MNSLALTFKVGMLVSHPTKAEWGPGKVLVIERDTVTVYWRDAKENKAGDATKRMNVNHVTLERYPTQSDPLLDNLPEFKDGKLAITGLRLTLEQGIAEFHRYFPKGFRDPDYIGVDKQSERLYKWDAHRLFVKLLGDGKLSDLLQRGDIPTITKYAQSVVSKVNLLSRFEASAFRDALKHQEAAQEFFSALYCVLEAPMPAVDSFEPYISSVLNLPSEGGTSPSKWTVLTILPFLARPETYMFLKPNATKVCADRLAFNLNYSPTPNWLTYSKLMEMSDLLMDHLRPLGAQDYIDIQSFIWVIDYYGKVDENKKDN